MPKPATVFFREDVPLSVTEVDHVDVHDGYVYAQKGDTAYYWPWYIVQHVSRDLSEDGGSA